MLLFFEPCSTALQPAALGAAEVRLASSHKAFFSSKRMVVSNFTAFSLEQGQP